MTCNLRPSGSDNLKFKIDPISDSNRDQIRLFFARLKKILISFFLLGKFDNSVSLQDDYMQRVLKAILLKKKFGGLKKIRLVVDFLNVLLQSPPRKKNETNYKFVFPKCFKFLKKN